MKSLPDDIPVTLVFNEVTVTRLPNGVMSLGVRYTVNLATEEFTGPVGGGATSLSDENILVLAEGLATAIQDRINSAVGLSSVSVPAEVEQPPEADWEL